MASNKTKKHLGSALMFFVGLSAVFLISCQKDSGGGSDTNTVNGYNAYGYNNCGNGYINSQYGCLPTAGCNAGYGMYMQQCIPAANTGSCSYGAAYVNGQCIPQQGNCQVGTVWNGSSCVMGNQQQMYQQQMYYPYNQMYMQQYYYQPYYQQQYYPYNSGMYFRLGF